MKQKTIKKHLRQVFDNFVKSVTDVEVRKALNEGTIITGGAIASLLLQEDPNDYDMYFKDVETATKVADYFASKFNAQDNITDKVEIEYTEDRVSVFVPSAGISRCDTQRRYCPVFMSSNAITLTNDIQLVLRFTGSPEEIHKNYDFVHCTSYWCSWDDTLECPKEALSALLSRELIYVGSLYPLASVIRTRKFIKRGFSCTAGQYLKMAWQLNALDLTDLNVLRDQLTGVDALYFHLMLSALEGDDLTKVDNEYLFSVIDTYF